MRRGYSASDFHLRMTREELGSYLGLKLETVSRLFSQFQTERLIEVQQKARAHPRRPGPRARARHSTRIARSIQGGERMFKHILIPTDGSPVSAKAVKAGIAWPSRPAPRSPATTRSSRCRRACTAKATSPTGRWWPSSSAARAAAKRHVDAVARAAEKAGVQCETLVQTARTPYEGIVEAAKKRRCDLILMASHGYRGLMRLTWAA